MTFETLYADVMSRSERFAHRQHLELTWLAVREQGVADAIELVSEGIQRTARDAGAPQKYHLTISRAWVEVVAHHALANGSPDSFDAFIERWPMLLDKRLLSRHYNSATLASETARTTWVPPDVTPLP